MTPGRHGGAHRNRAAHPKIAKRVIVIALADRRWRHSPMTPMQPTQPAVRVFRQPARHRRAAPRLSWQIGSGEADGVSDRRRGRVGFGEGRVGPVDPRRVRRAGAAVAAAMPVEGAHVGRRRQAVAVERAGDVGDGVARSRRLDRRSGSARPSSAGRTRSRRRRTCGSRSRLDAAGRAARLYVTALGLYEFEINGQRVGDDVFAPGRTEYTKRVPYHVYDVTAAAPRRRKRVRRDPRRRLVLRPPAHRPAADLRRPPAAARAARDHLRRRLDADDRHRRILASRRRADPLVRHADGRGLRRADGDPGCERLAAGRRRSTIPASRSSPTAPPPVRKIAGDQTGRAADRVDEQAPAHLRPRPEHGRLGPPARPQRPAGQDDRPPLHRDARQGRQAVHARPAHRARDGSLHDAAAATKKSSSRSFTFHGFRYVEVRDYPGGNPTVDDLTGVVVHSDCEPTGEFECSDPMINQLQSNIVWSQRGNFLDIPTDCPQRDERLGWTGDAQVFIRTAAFNMDVANFFTKWLQRRRRRAGRGRAHPVGRPARREPPPRRRPRVGGRRRHLPVDALPLLRRHAHPRSSAGRR